MLKIKRKYALAGILCLVCALSFASTIPTEISDNTGGFEATLGWALKIGGAAAILVPLFLLATNKIHGQIGQTFAAIIIVLGAVLFGIGWWSGKASSASSQIGSGFSIPISKSIKAHQ